MARAAKQLAPIMALITGLSASVPVCAGTESDAVLEEIRRLNQRIELLENALKHSQSEAVAKNGSTREKEIVGRLEDVERQVLSHDKKGRLMDALEGVSVEASMLMVGQRAFGGTQSGKGENRINYRGDVEVSLPAGNIGEAEGEIFAHFRMGQGNGLSTLDPTLTGTPNSTAFALTNGDDTAVLLAQAWVELDVPLGEGGDSAASKLEINVGKIDPFVFFDQNDLADDESAAYLNNVFVHNPLLDSGGDMEVDAYGFAPGLRLAWRNESQSPDYWQVSVGLFSAGQDSAFDTDLSKPFVIGQIEAGGHYLFGQQGVYRLYAWNRGRSTPFANEFDSSSERHVGWGFSVNQQVAEHVSLFGRYGHSITGRVRFDRAYTAGAEIGGAYWGREHDRLGIAAGWLDSSKAFRAAAPGLDADGDGVADFSFAPTGAEKQLEIYYAWRLNEHLELSPDFQWISKPGGDAAAKDIAILGLRAKASF